MRERARSDLKRVVVGETERGVKALEKRVASLQALLLATTLLNLCLGAAASPLRRVGFIAAGFLGLKALPGLAK